MNKKNKLNFIQWKESAHLAKEMLKAYHSIDIELYSDDEIINLMNLLQYYLKNRGAK